MGIRNWEDMIDFLGPTRHVPESELSNDTYMYPSWTKKVLGKLGKLCAATCGGKVLYYGIYLGFGEDEHDYYYRMFTKNSCTGKYYEVYETCVSGIDFPLLEDIGEVDEVKELLENWELMKSSYVIE